MSAPIARTPQPPYWAVVFTSQRAADDGRDYGRMSARLEELAPAQPGFLGIESVRDGSGTGITVSYWADEASIAAWKRQALHAEAQRSGIRGWYEDYTLRIARVERAYTKADSRHEGL